MPLRSFALTGTPGVGKTSLANQLSLHGIHIMSVVEIANTINAIGSIDEKMDAVEIDVEALQSFNLESSADKVCVDGHLSHFANVGGIVILRCQPEELRNRLVGRGYREVKIQANVEAEMIGGPWMELNTMHLEIPVMELDTTLTPVETLCEMVLEWIEAPSSISPEQAIDWL